MGTVYHVQQVFLNIEMALKVLDFSQASNASNLNRFAIEAKAAYALNHHTLVKVFDFGVLEQGQPYFAMEYIAGTTLADHLKKSGPLPLALIAPIFSADCRRIGLRSRARGRTPRHQARQYHARERHRIWCARKCPNC